MSGSQEVARATIFRREGQDVATLYRRTAQARAAEPPPHWTSFISVDDAQSAAAKAAELGGCNADSSSRTSWSRIAATGPASKASKSSGNATESANGARGGCEATRRYRDGSLMLKTEWETREEKIRVVHFERTRRRSAVSGR